VTVEALAKSVPAMGYQVVHVVALASPHAAASPIKVDGTTIENEFLRMKVDPKTGCVTSLLDKAGNHEAVAAGGCGNLIQAFKDVPRTQDAWEIRFDEDEWDLNQPKSVTVVERGPERAVVRIEHAFRNSTVQQDLTVYAGVPRVDVKTRIDWHEAHVLLKAAFPVNVTTDKATFEIPYGTIQRPTTRNTPEEQGMFEVPALRWGDLSNASQGFSLLNASKYGYDAKGNVIRLSLLRSPQMPAPDNRIADQGLHEFTYSLFAHSGGWQAANTMRQGYELNFPLIASIAETHAGPWPSSRSLSRIDASNAILTVTKKAEDNDNLIFRFYEFEGKRSDVRLQLPQKAASAVETDLMEKRGTPLTLSSDGREVMVPTGPYEIKTVEVTFAK
jgi:alpha-mannosidase